jgi:hypothetical protein
MRALPERLKAVTPNQERELVLPPRDPDLMEIYRAIEAVEDARYGMPAQALKEIIHSPKHQVSFEKRFGLTFEEYATRFLNGESMGKAVSKPHRPSLPRRS